jgi:hypothetical protein
LRISNGTTDYSLIGTIDTDGATNTSILISGTTRTGNAGNIQYFATTSGGNHIFYVAATTRMTISSAGVNIPDNLGITGRVGIGTAPHATYALDINGTSRIVGNTGIGTTPHATYKLDVLGDINVSGAFRINNNALVTNWLANTVDATKIYYNGGNVGIGNTNPLGTLHLGDASQANNDGRIIFAKCTTVGSTRICRVGYNDSFEFCIGDIGGGNTLSTWSQQVRINYTAPANSLVINSAGNVYGASLTSGGDLSVGGTSYLRNTYIYSGGEGSGIALYFGTPFYGTPTGASKGAIIAEPISSWSRHNLCFCLNTDANTSTNAGTGNSDEIN